MRRPAAAGRPEAERPDAGGLRQRRRGPLGERLLGRGVELLPHLVGPAVHAELVAVPHDVGDRGGMVDAVPAFDEEGGADVVGGEQTVEVRVAVAERGIGGVLARDLS